MLRAVWQQFAKRTARPGGDAVQLNFVDVPTICALHTEYFGDAGATDVITFPLAGPGFIGDIYVCYDVALDQARRYRIQLDHELARLALHGILHLLGFDDLYPGGRRRMRTLENQFLDKYFSEEKKAKTGVTG